MCSKPPDEWRRLYEEILNCRKCRLHANRKNPVPGEGGFNADILIVGEAPGRREDEEGRPFVGAAGKLLTELLSSIGLSRERDVYITNVVKCRPPGNRDPKDDEVQACTPYLLRQIAMLKPKIIITLGNHAGKRIFSLAGLSWDSVMRRRGKAYEGVIEGIKLMIIPTLHPASALYNPRLRSVLEKDFELIGKYVDTLIKGVSKEVEKKAPKKRSLLDFIKG